MDDATFQRLDRQVRALQRPDASLLPYYVVIACLALPALPFVLLPLYFRYHTLHFRFDAEGVSMGYGILFRRELHLTYARMQDIHLSQNLLERWLGIGTVTVQTAGAGEGGDMKPHPRGAAAAPRRGARGAFARAPSHPHAPARGDPRRGRRAPARRRGPRGQIVNAVRHRRLPALLLSGRTAWRSTEFRAPVGRSAWAPT